MKRACAVALLAAVACRSAPTDEEKIRTLWRDYRAAVQAADAARLQTLVSAAKRGELAGPAAAAKLQLVAQLAPAEPTMGKLTIAGAAATLELTAAMEGQPMTGSVRFVKEGTDWKVDNEEWTMRLDLGAGSTIAADFFPEGAAAPQVHAVLEGHQGEVSRLAFTKDGRFLVSASYGDFTLRVWRMDGVPQEVSSATAEHRVTSLVLSPEGRNVWTADVYKNVDVRPLEEGTLGTPRRVLREAGEILAISPDGAVLATAGFERPLRLWDAASGAPLETLAEETRARALRFLEPTSLLAGGTGTQYRLWTRGRGWFGGERWDDEARTIQKIAADSEIMALDVTADHSLIATGHNESSIVIFDLPSGKERANFFVRDAATRDVKFSPDGALLATAQQNQKVYLWDTKSGRSRAVLDGHRDAVLSLAWSPDGGTLASGGDDRRILLWRGGPPAVAVAMPPSYRPAR